VTRVVCFRLTVALFLLAIPRLAGSHAFGARYDLPLPLGLVLMAAGMAVAVPFLGALIFLIIVLDYPFQGWFRVSSEPFQTTYNQLMK